MRGRRVVTVTCAMLVVGLSTAFVRPAMAVPPEGCVGFPSIPQAFLCIDSFTPQNVVPGAEPGSTTVTIPEFCVFDCFGPTPVTVPLVTVTLRYGEVARISYMGQQYVVAVSPELDQVRDREGCRYVGRSSDGSSWSGHIYGGPWDEEPGTQSVTMTCWLQTNNPQPSSGQRHALVSETSAGRTGRIQPRQIAYVRGEVDNTYLCTQIDYTDEAGTHTLYVGDGDGDNDGFECVLVVNAEVGYEIESGSSRE